MTKTGDDPSTPDVDEGTYDPDFFEPLDPGVYGDYTVTETLNLNDDGTVSTVTYVLEAENDLTASTYLEGLIRPEPHFKGSVFGGPSSSRRPARSGPATAWSRYRSRPWTRPPGI